MKSVYLCRALDFGTGFTIFVLTVLWSGESFATVVAGVLTPDCIVIAADCANTAKDANGSDIIFPENKLLKEGNYLFACCGLVRSEGHDYDADKTIAEVLRGNPNCKQAEANIRTALSSALKSELERTRKEYPNLFGQLLDLKVAAVGVIFGTIEDGRTVAVHVAVGGFLNDHGEIEIHSVRHVFPDGTRRDGTYTFRIGQSQATDKYLASRPDKSYPVPAEEIPRFIVQKEIDGKTDGVGPPVVVGRIDSTGIHLPVVSAADGEK
jgi:hypothetical protein